MNRLTFALIVSLALNVGVVAAVGYAAYRGGQWPALLQSERDLPAYLALTTEQRRRWDELEAAFLRELGGGWREIRSHRERMIGEIFSERPDRARVESERAAIAALQTAQQRQVIEQLLRERDILDTVQRRKLADLLLRQAPASTFEERLHGN